MTTAAEDAERAAEALVDACAAGDIDDVVRILAEGKTSVSSTSVFCIMRCDPRGEWEEYVQRTPLGAAIHNLQLDVVKLLVET
jgi:hypothetical protein